MKVSPVCTKLRMPAWPHKRMRLLLPLLVLLPFVLAACASNTGIFGGGSWQASGLQNQSLRVLAVDPNHLQDVYAGAAQAGVFVSTDSGMTWKPGNAGLPESITVNALAFDLSGKKLYAATSAGLFVSSNSAQSWSQVAHLPADSYSALSFDVNTPQVVYVASAHSGVLMSRDNGTNWTSLSSGLPAVPLTSVLYDSDQKNLWVASASSIYRSSDNGTTWQAANTGLPTNVGVNALALGAVTSSSSDLIFAGTNHGFFRSSDAGHHWTESQVSLASLKIGAVLLDANQPNVVYVSTDIGVLRSNDSGQDWNQVAAGLPSNQTFAGLAQGDVNYTQLLVASRSGVYRYPGNGSVLDPSRLIPIILILLFFFLLYYLLVRRRRRLPIRRPTLNAPAPTKPEAGKEDGNALNGHVRPPDSVMADEQPES